MQATKETALLEWKNMLKEINASIKSNTCQDYYMAELQKLKKLTAEQIQRQH